MFSEMSFKCRSTTSFSSSSYTLTDPNSDPLYTLYPTRPEKAYGLGIYAPKRSNASTSSASASSFSSASFLTPRPFLKTLRNHASLAGPRPLHLHSKSYPTTSSAHSPLPPGSDLQPGEIQKLPAAASAFLQEILFFRPAATSSPCLYAEEERKSGDAKGCVEVAELSDDVGRAQRRCRQREG